MVVEYSPRDVVDIVPERRVSGDDDSLLRQQCTLHALRHADTDTPVAWTTRANPSAGDRGALRSG